jgi:hypothetical protein
MSRHPLRRLLATLLAVAFFSASMMQAMPAVAMPFGANMAGGMTMAAPDGSPDSAPMPCKGMTPACMIDLGCIFMIGIPVPEAPVAVHLVWAPVSYHWPSVVAPDGGIQAPDLRPPIRLS